MEQHLFILLFFTGIPVIHSVYFKYHLVLPGKNWTDAQAYCQARYTDLAIVKSNDEMARLQNEAQIQNFSSSAWIGLYNDIHSWRWSMGNVSLGFTSWYPGEPNNGGGNRLCVEFLSIGWYDAQCPNSNPFVCFDNTTGNSKYIRVGSSLSWYAAQTYCRTHYTDLASATDATSNSAILALASGWTWFGLFRDGWKWIDKTPFSIISWAFGKPDNALGKENCGYLNKGQAVDALCTDIMPFFCYAGVTGEQQILKVKVQSNQDVNDLAIMTAIMAKIKEVITDHGWTENITVTWRKQSDGNVFHKDKQLKLFYFSNEK